MKLKGNFHYTRLTYLLNITEAPVIALGEVLRNPLATIYCCTSMVDVLYPDTLSCHKTLAFENVDTTIYK